MSLYAIPIDEEEKPEPTVENVPDKIVEFALRYATDFRKCPKCDTQQWTPHLERHFIDHPCVECEFIMVIN